jgi:glyoxylase-like metal-dependent hydrolase (beta-lactamase superfamily II)
MLEREVCLENLVILTVRSTHYYLIELEQGWLMVDTGWAGELGALKSQLRRAGIGLGQIRNLIVTHLHPDHAGLTQEIKRASGARMLILEVQIPFLKQLETFYAGKGIYVPIQIDPGDLVLKSSNRAELERIGVRGEIVETPGHSDDSVSLVLDSGAAFTGDLHLPEFMVAEARQTARASWTKLLSLNVQTVYPGHGEPFPVERVRHSLEITEGE